MADTGVKYPGTLASTKLGMGGDNNAWVDPDNAGADDAAYASITAATFDTNDESLALLATNFNLGVPAGATIDGVVVEIERYYADGTVVDYQARLYSGGALYGDAKAAGVNWGVYPSSVGIVTIGGATDKWGATLDSDIVNNAGFGVAYVCQATGTNSDAFVDYIRMTVYYTAGAQTFPQSVVATAVGTPVLIKASSFYRTLSPSAVGVAALNKGMYLDIEATAIGVAALSLGKLLSQSINAVALGIANLAKITTYQQIISSTAVGIAGLSKATIHYLALVATAIGLPVVLRGVSKTLSATAIGVSVLARPASLYRAISATAIGVSALAKANTFVQVITATAIGVSALARVATHYLTITATAIGVLGIIKGVSKTLSATAIGAPVFNTIYLAKRTLGATAQGIAGLATEFISGSQKVIRRMRHFWKFPP